VWLSSLILIQITPCSISLLLMLTLNGVEVQLRKQVCNEEFCLRSVTEKREESWLLKTPEAEDICLPTLRPNTKIS
jgi:hypothetical protein